MYALALPELGTYLSFELETYTQAEDSSGTEVSANNADLPFQIISTSKYTGDEWSYLEIYPRCYRHPAGTYKLKILHRESDDDTIIEE